MRSPFTSQPRYSRDHGASWRPLHRLVFLSPANRSHGTSDRGDHVDRGLTIAGAVKAGCWVTTPPKSGLTPAWSRCRSGLSIGRYFDRHQPLHGSRANTYDFLRRALRHPWDDPHALAPPTQAIAAESTSGSGTLGTRFSLNDRSQPQSRFRRVLTLMQRRSRPLACSVEGPFSPSWRELPGGSFSSTAGMSTGFCPTDQRSNRGTFNTT